MPLRGVWRDCRGQERQQGGGCWSPPGTFKDKPMVRHGGCHPGGARGMRRAGSSAGVGVVSFDGQGSLVWSQALPHSCILLGAALPLSDIPVSSSGRGTCPEFAEVRCLVFRLVSVISDMFL